MSSKNENDYMYNFFDTLNLFSNSISDNQSFNDVFINVLLRKIKNGSLDKTLFVPLEAGQKRNDSADNSAGESDSANGAF